MNEELKFEIVNYLTDQAKKHQLSLESLDACMKEVRDVFYTDGLLKKGPTVKVDR